MINSLLSRMSKPLDEEEFKEACSSEEELIINEWELKLKIEKKNIEIDC